MIAIILINYLDRFLLIFVAFCNYYKNDKQRILSLIGMVFKNVNVAFEGIRNRSYLMNCICFRFPITKHLINSVDGY